MLIKSRMTRCRPATTVLEEAKLSARHSVEAETGPCCSLLTTVWVCGIRVSRSIVQSRKVHVDYDRGSLHCLKAVKAVKAITISLPGLNKLELVDLFQTNEANISRKFKNEEGEFRST